MLHIIEEKHSNPLMWSLLFKHGVSQVTYRARKYALDGNVKEAWRLKESYKGTFAMEAVAVSPVSSSSLTILIPMDFC